MSLSAVALFAPRRQGYGGRMLNWNCCETLNRPVCMLSTTEQPYIVRPIRAVSLGIVNHCDTNVEFGRIEVLISTSIGRPIGIDSAPVGAGRVTIVGPGFGETARQPAQPGAAVIVNFTVQPMRGVPVMNADGLQDGALLRQPEEPPQASRLKCAAVLTFLPAAFVIEKALANVLALSVAPVAGVTAGGRLACRAGLACNAVTGD